MKSTMITYFVLGVIVALPSLTLAEAEPYASIRFKTMYVDTDSERGDTKELQWELQGNTRVGVNFKVSDEVHGGIELGLEDSTADNPNRVRLRKAFGVYDFGPGNLFIGQDTAFWDWAAPQRAKNDNDLEGYGSLTISRQPQVSARMENGFWISLIDNPNENADSDNVEWPILGVGFDKQLSKTLIGLGAGYATFDNGVDDVDTWFVYGQVEQAIGVVKIAAKAYYGENLGDIGVSANSFSGGEDTETFAGFIAVYGNINDKVEVVAGAGYQNNDNDSFAEDDNQLTYYIDVPVTITKGFRVIPTLTVFDGLDASDGGEDEEELFVGAQWRYDL